MANVTAGTPTIESELAQIKRRGKGLIDPRAVVAFARDPETALHGQFEWDDGEAAERWRVHQARNLLRVYVEVIEGSNESVRVWASLPADRKAGGGYRAMVDVLSHKERRAQLLEMAKRDMDVFIAKYKHLKELAGVFAAMRRVKVA